MYLHSMHENNVFLATFNNTIAAEMFGQTQVSTTTSESWKKQSSNSTKCL